MRCNPIDIVYNFDAIYQDHEVDYSILVRRRVDDFALVELILPFLIKKETWETMEEAYGGTLRESRTRLTELQETPRSTHLATLKS
jgi:hypothetical protein